jgi:hypothetical protein
MSYLGAPVSDGDKRQSASDKPGSTSNHCKAVWQSDMFGNIADAPPNGGYYILFNDF